MKNNLLVGLEDGQIKYLSATHEGKKHDKKICDEDQISPPQDSSLYRDSGFQGHDLEGVVIHEPKKKPRGGQLSEEDKAHNRLISQVRIGVEHVTALVSNDVVLSKTCCGTRRTITRIWQ